MKTKSATNIPLPECAKQGKFVEQVVLLDKRSSDRAPSQFGKPEPHSGLSRMPKIQIKLEHGIVQAVDGLTPEIAIEVYDYDVEKYDDQKLSTDEQGQACEIKEWHAPE